MGKAKRNTISWLTVVWSLLLTNCSQPFRTGQEATPAPTEHYEIDERGIPILYVDTPKSECLLPYVNAWGRIPCNCFLETKPGAGWGNLKIGESQIQDVLDEFAPHEPIWDISLGALLYPQLSTSNIGACFRDETLVALGMSGDFELLGEGNVNSHLETWLTEFGNPDLVNWSYQYESRVVIWEEEGILVEVYIVYDEAGNYFPEDPIVAWYLLFPPIDTGSLEDSLVVSSLPSKPTYDAGPLPSLLSKEDPWNIETKPTSERTR